MKTLLKIFFRVRNHLWIFLRKELYPKEFLHSGVYWPYLEYKSILFCELGLLDISFSDALPQVLWKSYFHRKIKKFKLYNRIHLTFSWPTHPAGSFWKSIIKSLKFLHSISNTKIPTKTDQISFQTLRIHLKLYQNIKHE